MSANNQILIKEHKGKYLVFDNVMAESWSDENELSIKEAKRQFESIEKAMEYSFHITSNLEYPEEREYGIGFNELSKDGRPVKIVD